MSSLQIIPVNIYPRYKEAQELAFVKHFNKLKNTSTDLDYINKASVVYSSMIEGNPIDLDTYFKYFTSGMNTKTKSFKEITDLEEAYTYAQTHVLNEKNVLYCHKLLTQTLSLEDQYRGEYRDKNVFVMQNAQEVVYTGAEPYIIKQEMDKLFHDIAILRKRKLSMSEVFYFASMIHLIFVAIHPFADGNGRTARLIEKWFLADKLGKEAWSINSEKLYLKRSKSYYKNIKKIGENYKNIDLTYSLSFLLMLPMALRIK